MHSRIAFSASLAGGIQLSQLPDPDAEGWRDAMDREMQNLKSHDVYELGPSDSVGYSIGSSRMESLTRTRADLLPEATTSALESTMASHSRPSNLCAL